MASSSSNDEGRAAVLVNIFELRRCLTDGKERINDLPLTSSCGTQQWIHTVSVRQRNVCTVLQQLHDRVYVTAETRRC